MKMLGYTTGMIARFSIIVALLACCSNLEAVARADETGRTLESQHPDRYAIPDPRAPDEQLLNEIAIEEATCPDGFNPFRQPHYILLNLALGANGGDPAGTTFPITYEVDYVRVYEALKHPKPLR